VAARKRFASLDLGLALPLAFAVALNLPWLARRIVPIHDTFYNFEDFHVFYSHLFYHARLAAWIPYGLYGLQSDYEQVISLSPFSYLAGGIGALLRIRDALLLFKLGILGEQLAFVYGVYLLSRRIFATPATALVLSIAAAGTSVWYAQLWLDFRIYYLLPLVLYLVVCFQQSGRSAYVWLAGITGVAWALGEVPYVNPLLVLVPLGVVLVALAPDYRSHASRLARPSRASLVALGLFLLVAGAYLYFASRSLDFSILRTEERNPITGKVDLETFRSYAGNANLVIIANALLFGWPLHLPWGSGADNSVYIGLLPLLGLGIAVARERSRLFFGLVVTAILLVALSIGGAFTTLAYYLPGLAYYRHVGLVYGLVKVLLLLASGYGIERLWSLPLPRLSHPLLLLVGVLFLLELLGALPGLRGPGLVRWLQLQWGSHVLLRLAAYGAFLALCRALSGSLRTALALGLMFDLALYQLAVFEVRAPRLAPADLALLDAVQVRDLAYQPERSEHAVDPADPSTRTPTRILSQEGLDLVGRLQETRYLEWNIYPFAQFDPCRSAVRADTLAVGVQRLLSLERGDGLDLSPILGCGAPKLRVVADAALVQSADEARKALVAALRAGERLPAVIQPAAGVAPPTPGPAGGPAGRVEVTRFTADELEARVEVDASGGAWLVYADAFHPGWRASVNGQEVPISVANLGFKAVRVPPGASAVRFWFGRGPSHALRYAVAGFGAAWALGLVLAMVRSLLRGSRRAAA